MLSHSYQVHIFILAFTELSLPSRRWRWPFVRPSSEREGMMFPAQKVYYRIVTAQRGPQFARAQRFDPARRTGQLLRPVGEEDK